MQHPWAAYGVRFPPLSTLRRENRDRWWLTLPLNRRWILEFTTRDGVAWTVYEDAGTPASLVFDCREMTRRVRNYPQDWRRLGPVALAQLSWNK